MFRERKDYNLGGKCKIARASQNFKKNCMDTLIDKGELIDFVNKSLHDQSFQIDEVSFDNKRVSLRFHLENKEKYQRIRSFCFFELIKIPIEEHVLQIQYASHFEIDDTEKIGSYGFNFMEFLSVGNKIVIHTIPSIKFIIYVSQFGLELEETKKVIKWKKHIVFTGMESGSFGNLKKGLEELKGKPKWQK